MQAPARCPATLLPWRGAPGDDQAAGSEVCGKRGSLARDPGCRGRSLRDSANAIGPDGPFSAPFSLCAAPPRLSVPAAVSQRIRLSPRGVRHVCFRRRRRPFALCPAAGSGPGRPRPARDRRRGRLRRARLRRQRADPAAGLGRRGRLRAVLRQRAPRCRVPLAAVHRPVREQPRHHRRLPRLPRRRPGGLHPFDDRLAEPAGGRPAAGHRGLRLRDRAPRLAAAVGAACGHRRDVPERAAHPAAGGGDPGEGPGRPGGSWGRPGAGVRDGCLERDR